MFILNATEFSYKHLQQKALSGLGQHKAQTQRFIQPGCSAGSAAGL